MSGVMKVSPLSSFQAEAKGLMPDTMFTRWEGSISKLRRKFPLQARAPASTSPSVSLKRSVFSDSRKEGLLHWVACTPRRLSMTLVSWVRRVRSTCISRAQSP